MSVSTFQEHETYETGKTHLQVWLTWVTANVSSQSIPTTKVLFWRHTFWRRSLKPMVRLSVDVWDLQRQERRVAQEWRMLPCVQLCKSQPRPIYPQWSYHVARDDQHFKAHHPSAKRLTFRRTSSVLVSVARVLDLQHALVASSVAPRSDVNWNWIQGRSCQEPSDNMALAQQHPFTARAKGFH